MPPLLQLQKLPGKGDGGWKKVSLHRFLADQKIASLWKKCVWGHPIARATSYCLLPDIWLRASKNAFKVGSVKFTVTALHCEESMHWKLKQPRDLSGAGQKSRELTTPPEPPNRPTFSVSFSVLVRKEHICGSPDSHSTDLCIHVWNVNRKWITCNTNIYFVWNCDRRLSGWWQIQCQASMLCQMKTMPDIFMLWWLGQIR